MAKLSLGHFTRKDSFFVAWVIDPALPWRPAKPTTARVIRKSKPSVSRQYLEMSADGPKVAGRYPHKRELGSTVFLTKEQADMRRHGIAARMMTDGAWLFRAGFYLSALESLLTMVREEHVPPLWGPADRQLRKLLPMHGVNWPVR